MTDVDTPDAPFHLADMAPRRRRRWLVPLIVGVALAGSGGIVAFATAGNTDTPAGAASAAPSPPAVLLSENDACVQLKPLLLEASEIYAAFIKSDDLPKTEDARRIADGMRAIRKVAPTDMGPDIGQIVKGLVLLPAGGAGIDFEDWQNAGISLSTRCLGAR